MPAKPQQMADNQEKSDDLIAELAKLMASSAQGAEAETKSSVIKLSPLSEAAPAAPAPLRIPGMDAPKPQPAAPAAPASPTASPVSPAPSGLRLPGMEAPKPTTASQPAAPSAAAPQPATPPAAAPQAARPQAATPPAATPPAASPVPPNAPAAESRPGPPPVAPPTPRPVTSSAPPLVVPPRLDPVEAPAIPVGSAARAAAAFAQPRSTSSPNAGAGPSSSTRDEQRPAAVAAPEAAPKPQTPPATTVADDDSFDFDFGFGNGPVATPAAPASSGQQPMHAEEAEDGHAGADVSEDAEDQDQGQDQGNDDEDRDAIADLINAELGGPQAARAEGAPKAQHPASVEAVPASNYGHTGVQAPVLIGHPTRSSAPPTPAQPTPQPVQPQPAAGGDKFAVAPVFGLGSAPPRQEPDSGDRDPMAEIESLIGEAVRVQLSDSEPQQPQQPQGQQPPPVVPPLNTGFAPRRAGLRDVEPRTRSAEAAILAAAAATGAEVGRIEPSVAAEESPYRRSRVKPPNTRSFGGLRQYLGMAVAAVLLLAAGLGLYWVLGIGRGDPETAPVLTADTSPVKEAPAAPVSETAEAPRSVVFDEIDGVAASDEGETLVSRDETAGAPITEVARVEEPDVTETGLANRRVRTVTVRPDGTIVSADDAVAGSEALPVERPNVPELPGGSGQPSELLTAASGSSPSTTGTGTAEDPIAALMAGTEAATTTGEESTAAAAAAADAAGGTEETTEVAALSREPEEPVVFDGSLSAPVPMPRPADRSSLTGAGQAASAAPANSGSALAPASLPLVALTGDAPAATPAPASGGNANAYVQLASLPSEGEARSQVSAMQSRWGSLFGGQSLVVQRAELGGGRVTYRLRLPANSLQQATSICASIKANGGDCFATNG